MREPIGLKDGNGKEICEGDIISMPIDCDPWTLFLLVEWEEDRFAWPFQLMPPPKSAPYHEDWFTKNKIIGNVYENPELMAKINTGPRIWKKEAKL